MLVFFLFTKCSKYFVVCDVYFAAARFPFRLRTSKVRSSAYPPEVY